jgi:uncharacterized protein (TIGR02118 family)
MATVTVIYPKGADFKMDYYKSTHMPLVQKAWEKYGLKSWKVTQFPADAAFCVQALLEFGSVKDFQDAASGPEAQEVMEDIKNFSDKEPTILAGEVLLTS